jgi:hypothetical protein
MKGKVERRERNATSEYRVYQKNAGNSGTCTLGIKTSMRVLYAVVYSSTETVYFNTHVEKLLGAKHFKMSAICSTAPIVHLLSLVTSANAAVISKTV